MTTSIRKVRQSRARQPAPAAQSPATPPEVMVDFSFDRGVFHVVIANISDLPAYRVAVKFDKPFRGLGGQVEVSALRLFRGIEFLAPWKRIETLLDTSDAYFQRREPIRVTATISYQDGQKRTHKRQITHDLSIYKDLAWLSDPRHSNAQTAPESTSAIAVNPSKEKPHGSLERQTLRQLQLPR